MKWLLKILLKRKYQEHVEERHAIANCPFCYMTGDMIGEWFENNL